MSSDLKNLSAYKPSEIPNAKGFKIGIIVSRWNSEVTSSLFRGAIETLLQHGVKQKDIFTHEVPGSYELPLGAQWLLNNPDIDSVICLGCVIQGETRHFDFICDAVSNGIMDLNLKFNKPVIFGVLTTENQEQALNRAGGKHGNKGVEAAITAISMVALKKDNP